MCGGGGGGGGGLARLTRLQYTHTYTPIIHIHTREGRDAGDIFVKLLQNSVTSTMQKPKNLLVKLLKGKSFSEKVCRGSEMKLFRKSLKLFKKKKFLRKESFS